MIAKIQKWGNSQGFRLPKSLLESCHIQVGDNLDVAVEGDKIILTPLDRIRGRFDIRALTKKPFEKDGEVDFGASQGKEAW